MLNTASNELLHNILTILIHFYQNETSVQQSNDSKQPSAASQNARQAQRLTFTRPLYGKPQIQSSDRVKQTQS
jgi:hypothetical protein